MREHRDLAVADLCLYGGNRIEAYLQKSDTLGERGSAWVAENGGDRGDWSVVRSRKRKVTQPEDRGRDRSRVSERHGGLVQLRRKAQRDYRTDDREARRSTRVF